MPAASGHLSDRNKQSIVQDLYRPLRFLLHRRRAGKIGNLPPALREQINSMLQDGVPYADIIATLGDNGKHLNKDNLSRWRKADHQDWLLEQIRLKATRALPEPSPEVKELTILLHDFDADTLRAASSHDASTTLARVVNSVVRMAATAPRQDIKT
ncbi:MAG TPA: hypothetical protein VFL42_03390 [Terriglobales bacterium]|nr:hypothetical protein [Terriglobales bacterium]